MDRKDLRKERSQLRVCSGKWVGVEGGEQFEVKERGVAERTPHQGRCTDACLKGQGRRQPPLEVSKDAQAACQMNSHSEGGRRDQAAS